MNLKLLFWREASYIGSLRSPEKNFTRNRNEQSSSPMLLFTAVYEVFYNIIFASFWSWHELWLSIVERCLPKIVGSRNKVSSRTRQNLNKLMKHRLGSWSHQHYRSQHPRGNCRGESEESLWESRGPTYSASLNVVANRIFKGKKVNTFSRTKKTLSLDFRSKWWDGILTWLSL